MKIQLNNIGKRFKYNWIFRKINLSIDQTQGYAIVGPNGSGKSTLMKILSGHLTPSEGKIEFFDATRIIERNDLYRSVSFAAPYIDLIEEFSLEEAIQFHQQFKPFKDGINTQKLIHILNLPTDSDQPIRNFSSGMKQRVKLALAICSESSLLLLDEPTSNLDTQGIDWYLELVDQFVKDTILIVASNVEADYQMCHETIQVTSYKSKKGKI